MADLVVNSATDEDIEALYSIVQNEIQPSSKYQTRNEQDAALEAPSASSLKSATANSYQQFCTAIEQAVNYTPSDVLTALFNQMDELRKTYARLVRKKDKEEEASPVEVD